MYFISRYSWLTDIGLRVSSWQRWLVTSALILAFIALWYVTVFSTLKVQLAQRGHQQKHLAAQQAVYATLSQKVDQLDSAVAAEKTNWSNAVKKAQKRAGHDTLFGLLDLFTTHGVHMQAYYPRHDADGPWYTKQSAQLHLAGSFDQLINAFTTLNTNKNNSYGCEQLRLERRDDTIYCTATVSSKLPKEGEYVQA